MNNMKIHYDEEGDYLELHLGKPTKGFFKDVGNDIFERVDEETKRIVGVAIFNFKKRVVSGDVDIKLPFKVEAVSA